MAPRHRKTEKPADLLLCGGRRTQGCQLPCSRSYKGLRQSSWSRDLALLSPTLSPPTSHGEAVSAGHGAEDIAPFLLSFPFPNALNSHSLETKVGCSRHRDLKSHKNCLVKKNHHMICQFPSLRTSYPSTGTAACQSLSARVIFRSKPTTSPAASLRHGESQGI